MSKNRQQIDDLVATLRRLKKESSTRDGSGLHERSLKQYETKVEQFLSMRDGGDGGMFRQTEHTIRELHYSGWEEKDFQEVLEILGEVKPMSDQEKAERWPDNRNFFVKALSSLFGK